METKKYGTNENFVKNIDEQFEIFKRKKYQQKKEPVCDHKNTVIDQHSATIICTNCGIIVVERLFYEEIYF